MYIYTYTRACTSMPKIRGGADHSHPIKIIT